MRQTRVAIIVAENAVSWTSCQSISANLHSAYRKIFGAKAKAFVYVPQLSRGEVFDVATAIHAYKPDYIVFIDHIPHPGPLLHALHDLRGTDFNPQFLFHLYGDFTLYPVHWLAIEPVLRHYRALFVAASPRQSALVKRFVVDPEKAVRTIPFPVDAETFVLSPLDKQQWRKKFKMKKTGCAIVYSGRLSLQKNIVPMIKSVADMLGGFYRDDHLFIAGPIDDLGTPLFSSEKRVLNYGNVLKVLLSQLPPTILNRIHFLGNLPTRELVGLYNLADIFLSLSLHHDEDFGMAPAEALICGAPVILTDWGGYAQFVNERNDGFLIPVTLSRKGLGYNEVFLQKALWTKFQIVSSATARVQRRQRALERYSIEAVTKMLREVYSSGDFPRFTGFTMLTRQLRMVSFGHGVPYPKGPQKGGFYEKVYSAYLRDAGHDV